MGWILDDLRRSADHLLTTFLHSRAMWGFDRLVCQLRAGYNAWWEATQALTMHLDEEVRIQVFGSRATRFYRLDV